ncbi:Conserved_hypothetical protein [Hexamita inflata]|uniref:Uncharacterized protein n=1 Tax=Hexamita inflata TaxID=28002 RepID=A0AA86V1Q6_9EUKA|nr:Conserved hypothetical protein [Hexamita inflata]
MAERFVQHYLSKLQVFVPPQSIIQDSVALGSLLQSLSTDILAQIPSFDFKPASQQAHEQNFEMIQKLLESLGSQTDHFLQTIETTVDCVVEAIVLQSQFDNQNGLSGLKAWIQSLLKNYSIEFKQPRFTNSITQKVLFYCYSYSADSLNDYQNFKQSLEKDGIPLLIDFQYENEVNNFYQCALLYQNVVENGRPLYGLRMLNQQIEEGRALDQVDSLILQDAEQFVNKVEIIQKENSEKIDEANVSVELLTMKLNKLLQVNKPDQGLIAELTQIIEKISSQEILQYKLQTSDQTVTSQDLIENLVSLFKNNRQSQQQIFESAAHLQAVQLIGACISSFEAETEQSYQQTHQKIQQLKQSVSNQINFVQFIHQLLLESQNFAQKKSQLFILNSLKEFLNKNSNFQFELNDYTLESDETSFVYEQIKLNLNKQVQLKSKEFINNFLETEFNQLIQFMNSNLKFEQKQKTASVFILNQQIFERLLNIANEPALNKKFEEINDLTAIIKEQNNDDSGSGYQAQYKKLAIEMYDQLVNEFERLKEGVFMQEEQNDVTQVEVIAKLEKIVDGEFIHITEGELNKMRLISLQFECFVNGQQLQNLKKLKKVDQEVLDASINKLETLQNQILQCGEQPRVDNLNFVNLQLLKELTCTMNREISNQIKDMEAVQDKSSKLLQDTAQQILLQFSELKQIDQIFQQLSKRLSSKMSSTEAHELFDNIRKLQNQLYVPNLNHLDNNCPLIQQRFRSIFDLILKQNLTTSVINVETTMKLLSVALKLLNEYDQLTISIQKFTERIERVLAVLLQSQILRKRCTIILQQLANYINGYTISQMIQGLKVSQTASYNSIQLIQMSFNGELADELIDDIESGKLVVKDLPDEDALQDILQQQFAVSQGNFKTVQIVSQLFKAQEKEVQKLMKYGGREDLDIIDEKVDFIAKVYDEISLVTEQYTNVLKQKEEFARDLNLIRQQVVNKQIEETNFEMNCFKMREALDLLKDVQSYIREDEIEDILGAIDIQLNQIRESFLELIQIDVNQDIKFHSLLATQMELHFKQFDLDYIEIYLELLSDNISKQNELIPNIQQNTQKVKVQSELALTNILNSKVVVENHQQHPQQLFSVNSINLTKEKLQDIRNSILQSYDEKMQLLIQLEMNDEAEQIQNQDKDVYNYISKAFSQFQSYVNEKDITIMPQMIFSDTKHCYLNFVDKVQSINKTVGNTSQITKKSRELQLQAINQLNTFLNQLVQAIMTFYDTIVLNKQKIETNMFSLEQFNEFLMMKSGIQQVCQVIDLLINFTTSQNVHNLINQVQTPLSVISSVVKLQLPQAVLTQLQLLTSNQYQLLKIKDQLLIISKQAFDRKNLNEVDFTKTYLLEDLHAEFLANAEQYMITEAKVQNVQKYENSQLQQQILENVTQQLVSVNQPLLDKHLFYEQFGFESDKLLLAGSQETVSRILKQQSNFVKYGNELNISVGKLMNTEIALTQEDSIQRQQIQLVKTIQEKQQKSVRQEMSNQLAQELLNTFKLVDFSDQFDKQVQEILQRLLAVPEQQQSLQNNYKTKEKINELLKQTKSLEDKLQLRQKCSYSVGRITIPFNLLILLAQQKLKMLDDNQNDFEQQLQIMTQLDVNIGKIKDMIVQIKRLESIAFQVDKNTQNPDTLQLQMNQLQQNYITLQSLVMQVIKLLKIIAQLLSQLCICSNNQQIVEQLELYKENFEQINTIQSSMQVYIQKILLMKQQLKQFQVEQDMFLINQYMQSLNENQKLQMNGQATQNIQTPSQFSTKLTSVEGRKQFIRQLKMLMNEINFDDETFAMNYNIQGQRQDDDIDWQQMEFEAVKCLLQSCVDNILILQQSIILVDKDSQKALRWLTDVILDPVEDLQIVNLTLSRKLPQSSSSQLISQLNDAKFIINSIEQRKNQIKEYITDVDEFETKLVACREQLDLLVYQHKQFINDAIMNVINVFNQQTELSDNHLVNIENNVLSIFVQILKQNEVFRIKFDDALVIYVQLMNQVGRDYKMYQMADYIKFVQQITNFVNQINDSAGYMQKLFESHQKLSNYVYEQQAADEQVIELIEFQRHRLQHLEKHSQESVAACCKRQIQQIEMQYDQTKPESMINVLKQEQSIAKNTFETTFVMLQQHAYLNFGYPAEIEQYISDVIYEYESEAIIWIQELRIESETSLQSDSVIKMICQSLDQIDTAQIMLATQQMICTSMHLQIVQSELKTKADFQQFVKNSLFENFSHPQYAEGFYKQVAQQVKVVDQRLPFAYQQIFQDTKTGVRYKKIHGQIQFRFDKYQYIQYQYMMLVTMYIDVIIGLIPHIDVLVIIQKYSKIQTLQELNPRAQVLYTNALTIKPQ